MSKWAMAALLCGVAGACPAQNSSQGVPGPITQEARAALQMDEIRVSTARIALPPTRRNMWADEFDEVKGDYKLSNGKWMRLSMWGNRMYARIDGMPRTQLVAVSPYEFVALDETMKVSVDTESSANLHAVILLASRELASGPAIVTERLTASR